MDDALARRLMTLTSQFYDHVAPSFSATRQHPWEGWARLWDEAAPLLAPCAPDRPLRAIDVGCGNLRFERFLEAKAPGAWEAWCVDGCRALMGEGAASLVGTMGGALPAALHELDVVEALLDGMGAAELACSFGAPPADLAVAFGFLHHVPSAEARARLLRALVQAVRPGGLVAVSLWQFADDERLGPKAEQATTRARKLLGLPALPPGDYLLGWQDDPSIFRYCHSFAEVEVDGLARAATPEAREVARFPADGKSGKLNRYLVLQRNG